MRRLPITRICSMVRDWASATAPAAANNSTAKRRARVKEEPGRKPIWLRNRVCPDFTVAKPCGEQLDEYGARCGARYGAWFDLTGKISTPSLLKKFLISVPDLFSDLGKTDYIGPHQLIPNEPASNQHVSRKPGPILPAAFQLERKFDMRAALSPRAAQNRTREPSGHPGCCYAASSLSEPGQIRL